ncbi:MAG TPA: Hsp70 family protein [Candidatus Fimousia stercorigallinarum]|nr:Hsp70 family protein [Candidatus Fimousia stercorigallinarum]
MIIGIDLGTTNSLAAYFTEDGPQIIPNRLGNHMTPSVVSVDGEQVYVGETAKERQILFPDSSASVFKRNMGSQKVYQLDGKRFTAEELSSFVLRSLKEDAEHYLQEPVKEAVISVPAYFNEARRKATKRAGELAGLKVERIISEPTAAAIAYGLYQKKENTKFLVFDLGGGTFDVSILELFHNILEVRAVAGDNYLGGEDFTKVIRDLFLKDTGLSEEELDHRELGLLRKQAEQCKLAFATESSFMMNCQIKGEVKTALITRGRFEKRCEPLLDRIKKPVKKSLSDAKIKISDIDEIVLVGGGTKLRLVRKYVAKLFKKMPNTSVNPDEAVALGAAIQAAMKERREAIKEVILTDVCPFTLGTEVVVERGKDKHEAGYFAPIIERNTTIPASRTEQFRTVYDQQTKLNIHILQGESRFAANNISLGNLEVEVPPNKAGAEVIDITYTYDINSLLEVEVKVVSTGEIKKMIIKNQEVDMTDEEIEARMKELSYLKIHPKDQEENQLLLLRGERLYEENTGEVRLRIEYELREFEKVLNERNEVEIANARKVLKDVLDEIDEEW